MSEFTFLFRGREYFTSPSEGQKHMEQWVAWFKDLGAQGRLKDAGHPLEKSGQVVMGKDKLVEDGPYAEAKDRSPAGASPYNLRTIVAHVLACRSDAGEAGSIGQLGCVRESRSVALGPSSHRRGACLTRTVCDGRGVERISSFYLPALGGFQLSCGRAAAAVEHFRAASALARNSAERQFLDQRSRSRNICYPMKARGLSQFFNFS